MTSNQQVCPNGHPLARPGMTFCETCGAPIGVSAAAVSPAPSAPTVAGPRSNTPLILGLAAVVVIVVAAGSFFVLAPKAATTAAPSIPIAAAASRTPAGGQSAPVATLGAKSAAPSAVESTAPVITPVAGKTCHSAKFGVTVTYPAAWYEYTADADRTCALFDPKPFPTITDGSEPTGVIEMFSEANPMAKVVSDYQTGGAKVLQMTPTTIDGKAATLFEIDDTGVGVAPNGMHEYMYLIDLGQTTLVVVTQGIYDPSAATADWPYDGYKDNIKVVDSIAKALKFD